MIALSEKDWANSSSVYQDLAELYALRGELTKSTVEAQKALELARRATNMRKERYSLARFAWAAHLRGELSVSHQAYQDAEALEKKIDLSKQHLFSNRGIQYADHLRRKGNAALASRITTANLRIVEPQKWTRNISQCHRVLGDLHAGTSDHETARRHYESAVLTARSISRRDVLIESLLARGRWSARLGDVGSARADLDEALNYAINGGYRVHEADIRVALAWADRAEGNVPAARVKAEMAQQLSAEMGYYWGQVDAAEILAALDANN